MFTLLPSWPPITKISVDDKTVTALCDRGSGKSLKWIHMLVDGEYMWTSFLASPSALDVSFPPIARRLPVSTAAAGR